MSEDQQNFRSSGSMTSVDTSHKKSNNLHLITWEVAIKLASDIPGNLNPIHLSIYLPDQILSHLIWFHIIWFHLISSHLNVSHLMLSYPILFLWPSIFCWSLWFLSCGEAGGESSNSTSSGAWECEMLSDVQVSRKRGGSIGGTDQLGGFPRKNEPTSPENQWVESMYFLWTSRYFRGHVSYRVGGFSPTHPEKYADVQVSSSFLRIGRNIFFFWSFTTFSPPSYKCGILGVSYNPLILTFS